MLIEKRQQCPYRDRPHSNLAYAVYTNGSWCYSCNRGNLSARDFYNGSKKEHIVPKDLIFPSGATRNIKEFPLYILAWLYNYYVYEEAIVSNHIYYAPYSYFKTRNGVECDGESLVFPVIIDMEIVAYQQRFFPSKQFYSTGINKHIFDIGNYQTDTVVLVEDYISAIRVGEIENCIWLAGTNITNSMLNYITKNYSNVKIWLDGDTPGQEASQKARKKLVKMYELMNIKFAFNCPKSRSVSNIVTELDPKEYSNSEIRGLLNERFT